LLLPSVMLLIESEPGYFDYNFIKAILLSVWIGKTT